MNIIKSKIHRNLVATIGISVLALLLISNFTVNNPTQEVSADTHFKELTGYAWGSNSVAPSGESEGVGWISMNCSNTSSCNQSDYKVTLDEETGELTGYAWASNGVSSNGEPTGLGWLQFGGLSGFPDGDGTESANAYIDEDGNLQGWARFRSYGNDKLFSSETTTTTGGSTSDQSALTDKLAWDGWVSLSGNATDGSSYGPTRDSEDNLSGYAWGDNVVGWVDFSGVFIDEATAQCGTIHDTIVDNKPSANPSTNLCENGTPTNVSENNEDTWGWECIIDDSYEISDLGSPNRECSASCENDEWICNDQCIPKTQECNGDCPSGHQLNDSGECVRTTPIDPSDIATVEDMTFEAVPRIINRGEACNMEWSITTPNADLISCKITSDFAEDPEQPIIFNEGDSGKINGTESFNNIDATTQYTLTCSNKATGAELASQTARCSINPNFEEF